jgi:hypothetical protein
MSGVLNLGYDYVCGVVRSGVFAPLFLFLRIALHCDDAFGCKRPGEAAHFLVQT